MRAPLIAGNWKMHKTSSETEEFITRFLSLVPQTTAEILLIPPYTSLDRAGRMLRGTGIALGAQDLHPEVRGAFTGAVSAEMLVDCGCRYVLVGHSERRHVFGEQDDLVGRKLCAALAVGLRPVLCVGETLSERRDGATERVLERQLDAGLRGLMPNAIADLVMAYEPVWAIGTGETATASQAQDAAAWIRGWVCDRLSRSTGDAVRILYGGSVKPDNASGLLALADVDGVLVGGASLDPSGFAQIVAGTGI
ncbi:MAG: triose-phosphate isomerase [Candidatus Bipolaricaulis sp.]|nr:triose-phosphate isomerase [Candidatus Bipolaricaulis sp.]